MFIFNDLAFGGEFEKYNYEQAVHQLAFFDGDIFTEGAIELMQDFLMKYPVPTGLKDDIKDELEHDCLRYNLTDPLSYYRGCVRDTLGSKQHGNDVFLQGFPLVLLMMMRSPIT